MILRKSDLFCATMGWFSESKEDHTGGAVQNKVEITNKDNIEVEADELLMVLIIIAILVAILLLLKIYEMVKRGVRKNTQRDNAIFLSNVGKNLN